MVFGHYGEEGLEPFSSWENAILYIHRRQLSHSLVLVLDEFPYLANINTGILSVLQQLADHTLRDGKLFSLCSAGAIWGLWRRKF